MHFSPDMTEYLVQVGKILQTGVSVLGPEGYDPSLIEKYSGEGFRLRFFANRIEYYAYLRK